MINYLRLMIRTGIINRLAYSWFCLWIPFQFERVQLTGLFFKKVYFVLRLGTPKPKKGTTRKK